MTSVEPCFSTPLISENISINNNNLETYCYRLKSQSNAPFKDAGWQSGMLDLNALELRELLGHVRDLMQNVERLLFIDSRLKLELANGWININSPSKDQLPNNHYHNHAQYFFSFVYYLKVDKGNLMLVHPSNIMEYAAPDQVYSGFNQFNSTRVEIPSVKGKLIGFPSWIMHFAQPNTGDTDRISLAFNTRIVEKR